MFDDEEEEEELSDGEKLIRKKRDKELDDILRIKKELEDQEMEAKLRKSFWKLISHNFFLGH